MWRHDGQSGWLVQDMERHVYWAPTCSQWMWSDIYVSEVWCPRLQLKQPELPELSDEDSSLEECDKMQRAMCAKGTDSTEGYPNLLRPKPMAHRVEMELIRCCNCWSLLDYMGTYLLRDDQCNFCVAIASISWQQKVKKHVKDHTSLQNLPRNWRWAHALGESTSSKLFMESSVTAI